MSRPPLIGLPGRRKKSHQVEGYLDVMRDSDVDLYFADYARGVIEAGGLPVHLPIDADAAALAERLDGVLLTGGTDVDPARYGADPHPELIEPQAERDDFEFELLARSLDRDIPVLGICRGMQLINVHLGGTLTQHVPDHSRLDLKPDIEAHSVTLVPDSVLGGLYGEELKVNSLHHQTLDSIGTDLRVTAVADDGNAEGIELGETVVAVQWHPEMMRTSKTDPIFRWLVDRAVATG